MRLWMIGALVTSAAFADVVTDWNAIMLANISGQNPLAQARSAAITHLAMFEAVNAITKEYKPYLGGINAAPGASPEAAAICAAYRVLRNYFPANAPTLDSERDRSLARIPNGASKNEGVAIGETAAALVMARRSTDGSGAAMPYTPMTGIGMWQPTPPAFAASPFLHWSKVTPFGLDRPDQFRSKPPPKLNSRQYARDYNEVKDVGAFISSDRSQDRTNIARYASLTSPTLIWNSIVQQLAAAQGTRLAENARAFALLNMALADAVIAVFYNKYHYNFWRPITAIRAGDRDGNPRTEADPGFNTLIPTPAYPGYPSGFGGLSMAASYIVERTFGSGRHSIVLSHPSLPGVTFEYKRLRQIADDVADARVYAGIHFRFDQEEAEELGRRVAQWVHTKHLRCVDTSTCEDNAEEAEHDGN